MSEDRFGLPLTASSAAAAAYVEGVDLMFAMRIGAADRLEAALALDPEFALAHAARARLHQSAANLPQARRSMAAALEYRDGTTERERHHVEILALALEGRSPEALGRIYQHVERYPTDAVPLSLALGVYGLLGFSGRIDHHQAQLELLSGLADAWGEDWWFSAALGWAYVEIGSCAEGIPLLDRSLELNPQSAHAAHGRTHGYYELGDADGGRVFVERWLEDYDPKSPLHCHLAWHAALFALQQGDPDAARGVYDRAVGPAASHAAAMLTLVDAASFAWRTALGGQPLTQEAIAEIHRHARRHFPDAGVGFVNVHNAMALLLADDRAALAALRNQCHAFAEEGRPAAGLVDVLLESLERFAAGQFERAASGLDAALPELDRIGGSHAQRDVMIDTLIAAYARAGRAADALRVTRQRSAARASHLDGDWQRRSIGDATQTPD